MRRVNGKRIVQSYLPEYMRLGPTAAGSLHLGIDIGSVSCKLALLDDGKKIRYLCYERTHGRSMETARRLLSELFGQVPPDRIATMVGTGSAGRALCKLLNIDFVNELICQSAAIRHLQPQVRTLIEMGGQDSKIVFLSDGGKLQSSAGGDDMVDFAMNTNCAAGTGSFLDQQATRLGVDIESEFGRLALQSETPPRVAGRCSVFAKTDMIHLQQQATPMHDIVAGLCLGLARNLKSNLCRGKEIAAPVAFCGGVAANAGVARAIEEVFELGSGGLIIPKEHAVTGAIGAALAQMRQGPGISRGGTASRRAGSVQEPRVILSKLDEYIRQGRKIGHRLKSLAQPTHPAPASKVHGKILAAARKAGSRIPAYLGIDVGSISTNVVVMDEHRHILSKAYLMTAGRPLEAVRQGLEIVAKDVHGLVEILGAATTGSGRYLTGDFVGADLVINEITAQATGAAIVDQSVDTIFEIGGQDSKYISLEDGVVVDFEMNHACAAGTGSFLEEQAERLGMSIKDEFANEAFTSQAPIRLGERCTVFMESDLLSYQQQGAERRDLVAGLAYSIVTNYLNRVVGHRRIGQRIFFQGGTAFNRAVTAAFEAVMGKDVVVPDHHEVTGALGGAELARRHMDELAQSEAGGDRPASRFRGFDLSRLEYKIRSFECEHCPNNCEIKEVILPDSDPLYYGSRCDRYNLKKDEEKSQDLPDLFSLRQQMLERFARLDPQSRARKTEGTYRGTIGIPMCLSNYQLLPLWGTFFDELGFDAVPSGKTSKALIQAGAEAILSQACFPVKVAHGHVLKLVEKGVDYIWLPSIISMPADYPENQSNQLCPYVQTIPYQMRAVLLAKGIDLDGPKNRLIDLHLRLEDAGQLRRTLQPLARMLNVTKTQISRALAVAMRAQRSFELACRRSGREVLDSLSEDQQACVIISRPYNGCDPGVSLDLPRKLRQMNILAIPMDLVDLAGANVTEPQLQKQMYWKYGQHIFRAAHIIRQEPRLNAIYLSNFSCGPDSFIISLFKELMTCVGADGAEFRKPTLVLEIDEHSADAGVITRLEAFHESLKATRQRRSKAPAQQRAKASVVSPWRRQWGDCLGRTLYIPWMGDSSYAVAAAFRHCGQEAQVLPIADEETLRWGRKYTSGRECLPCIITVGNMLKKISEAGFDPAKAAFFMPGTSGPCRFGQYHCLQRLILKQVGMPGTIPIVAPNQDTSFYDDMRRFRKDPSRLAFTGVGAIDLLFKSLLRIRPYEKQPGRADQVYRGCLDRIVAAVEAGVSEKGLAEVMEVAASQLAQVPLDHSQRRPLVAVVGEIYVRNHVFANCDVIRQLEAIGAEVNLASVSEWLYYTNLARKLGARRRRAPKPYLENLIKNYFQHKIEKQLAAPLEKYFGPLAEGDINDVIEMASPYLDVSFEGEAILSVGRIVEMYHHGASGAVSVGPFTCMPSNIVCSVTRRLSSDCGGMPIISISYDGQQDPTLQTRLEAFMHQVRNFRPQRIEAAASLGRAH